MENKYNIKSTFEVEIFDREGLSTTVTNEDHFQLFRSLREKLSVNHGVVFYEKLFAAVEEYELIEPNFDINDLIGTLDNQITPEKQLKEIYIQLKDDTNVEEIKESPFNKFLLTEYKSSLIKDDNLLEVDEIFKNENTLNHDRLREIFKEGDFAYYYENDTQVVFTNHKLEPIIMKLDEYSEQEIIKELAYFELIEFDDIYEANYFVNKFDTKYIENRNLENILKDNFEEEITDFDIDKFENEIVNIIEVDKVVENMQVIDISKGNSQKEIETYTLDFDNDTTIDLSKIINSEKFKAYESITPDLKNYLEIKLQNSLDYYFDEIQKNDNSEINKQEIVNFFENYDNEELEIKYKASNISDVLNIPRDSKSEAFGYVENTLKVNQPNLEEIFKEAYSNQKYTEYLKEKLNTDDVKITKGLMVGFDYEWVYSVETEKGTEVKYDKNNVEELAKQDNKNFEELKYIDNVTEETLSKLITNHVTINELSNLNNITQNTNTKEQDNILNKIDEWEEISNYESMNKQTHNEGYIEPENLFEDEKMLSTFEPKIIDQLEYIELEKSKEIIKLISNLEKDEMFNELEEENLQLLSNLTKDEKVVFKNILDDLEIENKLELPIKRAIDTMSEEEISKLKELDLSMGTKGELSKKEKEIKNIKQKQPSIINEEQQEMD